MKDHADLIADLEAAQQFGTPVSQGLIDRLIVELKGKLELIAALRELIECRSLNDLVFENELRKTDAWENAAAVLKGAL